MQEIKELKIIHISTSLKGGAGTAAFRIHEALLSDGFDSNFLCLDHVNEDKSIFKITLEEKIYSNSIVSRAVRKYTRILSEYLIPKISFIANYHSISNFLECETSSMPYSDYDVLNHPLVKSADIIHLHWVAGLLDYPSFFSKVDKTIVWTFHDMNPFQGIFHYNEDELRNFKVAGNIDDEAYKIKLRSIKSCTVPIRIVCPSEWLTMEAKSSKLFNQLDITTIPYPIDFDVFQGRDKKMIREKLNISETENVFLFICQSLVVHRKGFEILLAALKVIKNKNVTILAIGEESIFDVGDIKVKFTGKIEENSLLSEYYSVADAFIIPSREDNLPNVMIESLSCGTPIIGFSIGGLKDHIFRNLTGVLAKEINCKCLADAINEFINNKKEFDPVKIRNYAVSKFGNSKISSRYSTVYCSLINGNHKKNSYVEDKHYKF